MSVVLYVDAARWRAHQAATVSRMPGLVPVVKGNAYGFGRDRLIAECARLSAGERVDTVAVGTYLEAPAMLAHFPGRVLVLEPYRPAIHAALGYLDARSLVQTVTSVADLRDLVARIARPHVVLEGLTTMNRHGMPAAALRDLLADSQPGAQADIVGATLHLPLGSGQVEQVRQWVDGVPDVATWFVSHLSPDELDLLRAAYPHKQFRPRVGTAMWLGDAGALSVRAHVLDVRPVENGDRAGYRGRRLRRGHLLVVSGGTAHGVALEAPSGVSTVRQRGIALAEGILEAAGRIRSPFLVAGRHAWFVEPPHMQVSLLFLPERVEPPEVGDTVPVRVRHTTLLADNVTLV